LKLHWDAEKPEERVAAIISKAIQDMNVDKDSPLYGRIQVSETTQKNPQRCLTLASLFGEIEKKGFHIAKIKSGHILEYGPLWAGEDNLKTLKRTEYILNNWVNIIRNKVIDWWDKGSSIGGGIAMNDGLATCIQILRSVFDHLEKAGKKLIHLTKEELLDLITPYADVLGDYFGSFNEDERKRFRDLRGVQGVTTRVRRCQQAINEKIKSFNPEGLEEFIATEKAQTNKKAKDIIDDIEIKLQKFIINKLKTEFGPDENEWWMLGVPLEVRKKVSERFEEEGGKRGGRENYFDLIHYRKIITDNWGIFDKVLGYEKEGRSKDARTSWLSFINEKRKVVAHPTSAVIISLEDFAKIEMYGEWLNRQIENYNVQSGEKE
jgi:DNA sulfur modification protein DndB